jgi:hypothetical protein
MCPTTLCQLLPPAFNNFAFWMKVEIGRDIEIVILVQITVSLSLMPLVCHLHVITY